MSSKDVQPHRQGRQHQQALNKVDDNLRPGLDATCIAPSVHCYGEGVRENDAGRGTGASTSMPAPLPMVPGAADTPAGSSGSNGVDKSTSPTKVKEPGAKGPKKPKKKSKPKKPKKPRNKDPLEAFFALYPPFQYDRLAGSHNEFRRLCAYFGWPSRHVDFYHAERKAAWEGFRIAMVEAFNATFGKSADDLDAWGRLCVLVGMEDVPEGLKARRSAIIATHVNLCDLLDTTRQRSRVHVFAFEAELRRYTLETGKIFPKEDAYAGGLLKYLLREILGSYHGHKSKNGKGEEKGEGEGKSKRSKNSQRGNRPDRG